MFDKPSLSPLLSQKSCLSTNQKSPLMLCSSNHKSPLLLSSNQKSPMLGGADSRNRLFSKYSSSSVNNSPAMTSSILSLNGRHSSVPGQTSSNRSQLSPPANKIEMKNTKICKSSCFLT